MTRSSDELPVIGRLPGHLHEPLRHHLAEPVVLTTANGVPLAVMVAAVTWDQWARTGAPQCSCATATKPPRENRSPKEQP